MRQRELIPRILATSARCKRLSTDVTLQVFHSFYRAMHFSAKRSIAIACRLSVCLSVTLVDCNHIGWNSSKIISPLAWDVRSFQPQHDGSAPRGTPLNLDPK